MEDLILFTHIPKTSGTSLDKELIEANFPLESIFYHGNIKKIVPAFYQKYQVISGHFTYGLHLFSPRKVKYMTFLREPIDRAVSYYYFIQQAKHRDRAYAESVTLKEFYENKKFHNHQTRMLSGWWEHKFYKYISTSKNQQKILDRAINNLQHKYYYFGILEEREKSIALCQQKFDWSNFKKVEYQKKTIKRRKVQDLDQSTLDTIIKANELDLQLYSFALELFHQNNLDLAKL